MPSPVRGEGNGERDTGTYSECSANRLPTLKVRFSIFFVQLLVHSQLKLDEDQQEAFLGESLHLLSQAQE